TSSLRMVLRATVRRMCGSKPLYTTPIAPLPSTSEIVYLPSWAGVPLVAGGVAISVRSRCEGARSGLEHLHGLREALLHAVERLREHSDLVAASHLEIGCVHAFTLPPLCSTSR